MLSLPTPEDAARVAFELLGPLGRRWEHVQGVAARAVELAEAVAAEERNLLVVAAWWHDLGYATQLSLTGMHQIDGARYLSDAGYPERLCSLVAHHSAAECEAEQRGLVRELAEWRCEDSPVADALWTADMTTGPAGESLDYPSRLAEIMSRYDSESIVGRAMMAAQPAVSAAIERTEARLEG